MKKILENTAIDLFLGKDNDTLTNLSSQSYYLAHINAFYKNINFPAVFLLLIFISLMII